jgi:hypothetical protein
MPLGHPLPLTVATINHAKTLKAMFQNVQADIERANKKREQKKAKAARQKAKKAERTNLLAAVDPGCKVDFKGPPKKEDSDFQPELRFKVGDKVLAKFGTYQPGTIIKVWDDGDPNPKGGSNPYRIKLDDVAGTVVCAHEDLDKYVMAQPAVEEVAVSDHHQVTDTSKKQNKVSPDASGASHTFAVELDQFEAMLADLKAAASSTSSAQAPRSPAPASALPTPPPRSNNEWMCNHKPFCSFKGTVLCPP